MKNNQKTMILVITIILLISLNLFLITNADYIYSNAEGPGFVKSNVIKDEVIENAIINLASESNIYIHDGIATVYDAQTNEFYDLDNLVKFDNYYTKTESNERFYTKTEVNNMFGNITQAQEAIIYTLDKGSVNIPNGD